MSKITPSLISKIKKLAGKGSHTDIANKFDVSAVTVCRVLNGKYDTGRLVEERDPAPAAGFFNVDEISKDGKTWLV
jgi:hypothetical protein